MNIQLCSVVNGLLVAFAAVSTLSAQENVFGVVGAFPHYAVGNEWSSTIYFDVVGTGKNINGNTLTTCSYKVEFYNQTGAVQHTERFSRSSDYSFRTNVVRIVVPDFGNGQLVYGPAVLSSDCSESSAVKIGELVFSQRSGDKTNDGTVRFLTGATDSATMTDMDKFVYGFAVFNRSSDAMAFFVSVKDVSTNTTILKDKLLFTLAGKEQKIFVLTDVVPELRGRKGMHVIDFSNSPRISPSPMYLVLKFNATGLFSTGYMYWNLDVD